MQSLGELLRKNKTLRVIGFDDAPFSFERGSAVKITGVVCANTRFEGMLWGEVEKDGDDATNTIVQIFKKSKFFDQISMVLTDGIAVGGFNIIDMPGLALELQRPCIAVMRRMPDLEAIDRALKNFSDYETRKKLLENAGEIHARSKFCFQAHGCDPEVAAEALDRLTDNGKVPEALRLAHMIGSAVITGQSSKRV